MQQYQEWTSLNTSVKKRGYTLEATLDAWQGRVINPDWKAP
jgi:hypothetical protein